MATRLIFGCGYLGRRVTRRWLEQGDRVIALTRKQATAEAFRSEGIEPIVADVTDPESLRELPSADTLLYAVGYDRSASPSIHEVYAVGFRRALAATPEVGRAIYISTTGVYGDAGGEWVDEQTPPNPARDGGRASLAAEQALYDPTWRDRRVILRLAGIYGPDRLPYLAKLVAGEPIAASQHGWLNLIHVDDAAEAVVAAASTAAPPAIVCVSDGDPPQRGDYYAEAARLLAAPTPSFETPAAGSPRAARAAADKRVANRLLIERLGVRLKYPSYREGLAAILAG